MAGEGSWCEDCDDYFAPNEEGTECKKPTCGTCQITTKQGTCEVCPEYYCADELTKTMCVTDDTCGEKGQVTGLDGKCKDCPPFKHPSADARSCTFKVCEGNKILKEDGDCYACPAGKRPDDARRSCIKDTCVDREVSDELGYCNECPIMTKPNENRTNCIPIECADNQIYLTTTHEC